MFHFPISDGVRVLACVRVGACVCCGGGGGPGDSSLVMCGSHGHAAC